MLISGVLSGWIPSKERACRTSTTHTFQKGPKDMSHSGKKRGFWLTFVTAIVALFASACGQAPAAPQAPAQVPPGSVDTTRYKKDGPYTLCFSNASASNTWRLAMVEHVRYEVKQHPEIKTFRE